MMRLELQQVAEVTGGALRGANGFIQGMSHDTRQIGPGNLFAALPGERSHGHMHLEAARAAGAGAALVSDYQDCELAQLRVADVLRAMGLLAAFWRARMPAEVLAVTGSNGKTTVKEMLAAILRRQGATLATEGNYNNEIGVPLTLARLAPDHMFAVLELGASRPGDIEYLAGIAAPRVAVVTNAAAAHLEGFGSVEGVARTKGELFAALGDDGTALINRDDPHFVLWQELAGARRVITFGVHAEADIRLVRDNATCRIATPSGEFDATLKLPGRHNRLNALAATAAALAVNIELDDIRAGLESVESLPGRLRFHRLGGGGMLIDDTYNANPASLYAALSVLAGQNGERWLVLGDMAELGPTASKLHREMGLAARDLGVERLFALGDASREAVASFGRGATHFEDPEALIGALEDGLHSRVRCLVKGSRSMAMERVVDRLIGEAQAC